MLYIRLGLNQLYTYFITESMSLLITFILSPNPMPTTSGKTSFLAFFNQYNLELFPYVSASTDVLFF